jgi:AraC family transcriptional regulator
MTPNSNELANMRPYTQAVARRSSDGLPWRHFRLVEAVEPPADVRFAAFDRHLINVTLTGTTQHEAEFGDVVDRGPTAPGTVLTIPKGLSGRFAFSAPGEGERSLIAEFDEDLFLHYCSHLADDRFLRGGLDAAPHRAMPQLSALLQVLASELHASEARGPLFAESVIRAVAIEIAASAWTAKPQAARTSPFSTVELRRLEAFIAEHIAEPISLSDLADAAGSPVGRFSRAFKAHFGRTPYAYVLDRRVEEAVRLLSQTATPIAEIAAETGFADQQHMTSVFAKRLKRSPGSFRNR